MELALGQPPTDRASTQAEAGDGTWRRAGRGSRPCPRSGRRGKRACRNAKKIGEACRARSRAPAQAGLGSRQPDPGGSARGIAKPAQICGRAGVDSPEPTAARAQREPRAGRDGRRHAHSGPAAAPTHPQNAAQRHWPRKRTPKERGGTAAGTHTAGRRTRLQTRKTPPSDAGRRHARQRSAAGRAQARTQRAGGRAYTLTKRRQATRAAVTSKVS